MPKRALGWPFDDDELTTTTTGLRNGLPEPTDWQPHQAVRAREAEVAAKLAELRAIARARREAAGA